MQLYIRHCFIICMCKILVQNFIIKDILKKKNVVHRISVRTIINGPLCYVEMALSNLNQYSPIYLSMYAVFNGVSVTC